MVDSISATSASSSSSEEGRVQQEQRPHQQYGDAVPRGAPGGDQEHAQGDEESLVDLEDAHENEELSDAAGLELERVVEEIAAEEHGGRTHPVEGVLLHDARILF